MGEDRRRFGPRARLALLGGCMGLLLLAFWIFRPVSEEQLRDAIDPLGAAAPLVYVPVSALLGALLVPGALLAAAAGLLFGTWLGLGVSLAAAVLSSLVAHAIGTRAGREGFDDLAGPRASVAAGALRGGGTGAVIVQRLLPWVPDGPCNYGWGIVGVTRRALVLGTVIGATPRALAYASLGDSLDDLSSPGGIGGAALLLMTGILGAGLAARAVRRGRAAPADATVGDVDDDTRYQITREGLEALEAELHELETTARNEMALRIKTAREWGDLKENSEYHDAKNSQAHLESKILRLQDRRRNAVVVEPTHGGGEVVLGSEVKVLDTESGKESSYSLVTATDADPVNGKLSIDSPLAHALAGAKLGDEVVFRAPRGAKTLRIVALA